MILSKAQAQAVPTSPTHPPHPKLRQLGTMSLPSNQAPQLTAHIGKQFLLTIMLPIASVIILAVIGFFVFSGIKTRRALAATGRTDLESGKADTGSLGSSSTKSKSRSDSSSEEYMMTTALAGNIVQAPLQPHF